MCIRDSVNSAPRVVLPEPVGPTSAVVVPARIASTRLPEKPLLRETGKFLVQHRLHRRHHLPIAVVIAEQRQAGPANLRVGVGKQGGQQLRQVRLALPLAAGLLLPKSRPILYI